MPVAMVGLGRMGGNMARRLMRGGHEVVAYATDAAAVTQLAAEGAVGAATPDELVGALRAPRVVWIMVPAGPATEQVVADLGARVKPGDTIVDGGNSYYKDDVRRMKALRQKQGTTTWTWGRTGVCGA
jgi:6-phosphogluconate dehydrogenase